MKKTNTDCCALCQLSGLNNNTTQKELQNKLIDLSEQSNREYIPGDNSGMGQKAIFVITTPTEYKLEGLLVDNGFENIHTFDRRRGYPEGKLKMYIKNL